MGRQQNKDEKLSRIRESAAALFVERGFDGTTTSAVAERAGIAKGTLFLYARSKEDLVALVFEDRLGPAIDRAFATIPKGGSIVDEASHVFSTFFAVYAPMPALARIFVRARAALELSVRGLLPPETERKGSQPCTPPPAKRAASTPQRARSVRTGSATSKRTASATAATKRSGSR